MTKESRRLQREQIGIKKLKKDEISDSDMAHHLQSNK